MSSGWSRVIQIIRHAEKPPTSPPPNGIDIDGNQNDQSLIPQGWQRAGAIASLFAPFDGVPRAGRATPGTLFSPGYGTPPKTVVHRTYQTILPVSLWLGVPIDNSYAEGDEASLGAALAAVHAGITLVCWEHTAIAEIADAIVPITNAADIPQSWPSDRFDVVYTFTWDETMAKYTFGQVPQMLLSGDVDAPIPVQAAAGA